MNKMQVSPDLDEINFLYKIFSESESLSETGIIHEP